MIPPFTGIAEKLTGVPEQILPVGFAVMETVTGVNGFTLITMELEGAGFPIAQPSLEVRVQVITSPLTGVKVKTGLLVPEGVPLTFHVKSGDAPPLEGLAVNVTEVPAQTGPGGAALIAIPTGRSGFTVMVMELHVAGFPEGQPMDELRSHVTISPFTGG